MTIRENLLVLIKAIEDEPSKAINLNSFEQEGICGTLHCALGLATTLPHFYTQGLAWGEGRGDLPPCPAIGGRGLWQTGGLSKLDAMFGEDSYDRLFEPRSCGIWDDDLINWSTDKELAIARLRKQLELYP